MSSGCCTCTCVILMSLFHWSDMGSEYIKTYSRVKIISLKHWSGCIKEVEDFRGTRPKSKQGHKAQRKGRSETRLNMSKQRLPPRGYNLHLDFSLLLRSESVQHQAAHVAQRKQTHSTAILQRWSKHTHSRSSWGVKKRQNKDIKERLSRFSWLSSSVLTKNKKQTHHTTNSCSQKPARESLVVQVWFKSSKLLFYKGLHLSVGRVQD